MNDSKINYLVCVLFMVPWTTECMFLTLAKKASFSTLSKRYYSCNSMLSNRLICSYNHLIETEIWNATQYPYYESCCAENINNVLKANITEIPKEPCCHDINMHLAVLSNLPVITRNLLEANPELVNVRDVNGSLPIDLAQESISLVLKNYNSPEKTSEPRFIRVVRVPIFGWVTLTPLARFCLEGDLINVMKIMQETDIDDATKAKLRMIALTSYWRSRNDIFLKIACYLETDFLQKCC